MKGWFMEQTQDQVSSWLNSDNSYFWMLKHKVHIRNKTTWSGQFSWVEFLNIILQAMLSANQTRDGK